MTDVRVDITVETQDCICRSFIYGNPRELIVSKATPEEFRSEQANRVDITRKAELGWFMRLLVRLAKWFLRRYIP